MIESAITFQNVTVEVGGRQILQNINFQIEKGCLTAIMGPNGAGKTTLIHALFGLIPFEGRILFGVNQTAKRPRIGYVPQKVELDRGSPITVQDFLIAGMVNFPLWAGAFKRCRDKAIRALEKVGIPGIYLTPLSKISGGELQRVLLAQALISNPEILILDEPVAAVDISGEALFCELLDGIHRDLKLTTLLITHDLSVVSEHAHHVLCLNKTVVCAGTTREVLTQENLRRVFSPHIDSFLQHHHYHKPEEQPSDDGTAA